MTRFINIQVFSFFFSIVGVIFVAVGILFEKSISTNSVAIINILLGIFYIFITQSFLLGEWKDILISSFLYFFYFILLFLILSSLISFTNEGIGILIIYILWTHWLTIVIGGIIGAYVKQVRETR